MIRWTVVLTFLNAGLVLIVFGQMAKVNECSKYLQDTFFNFGYFMLASAALSFAVALLGVMATWRHTKRTRKLRRLQEQLRQLEAQRLFSTSS